MQVIGTGFSMSSKSKITSAYQNVEKQSLGEAEDPHFIVLMMFDALLKSMALFRENISAAQGTAQELKSESFARALTIIYAMILVINVDWARGCHARALSSILKMKH